MNGNEITISNRYKVNLQIFFFRNVRRIFQIKSQRQRAGHI